MSLYSYVSSWLEALQLHEEWGQRLSHIHCCMLKDGRKGGREWENTWDQKVKDKTLSAVQIKMMYPWVPCPLKEGHHDITLNYSEQTHRTNPACHCITATAPCLLIYDTIVWRRCNKTCPSWLIGFRLVWSNLGVERKISPNPVKSKMLNATFLSYSILKNNSLLCTLHKKMALVLIKGQQRRSSLVQTDVNLKCP